MNPLSPYTIRLLLDQAKAELARKAPRALVLTQRKLIATAETLTAEVERLWKENADLVRWRDQYSELVADWNMVVDTCRELGIDVASPFPTNQWVWRCNGGGTGQEATAGAAMAAALRYRLSGKGEV